MRYNTKSVLALTLAFSLFALVGCSQSEQNSNVARSTSYSNSSGGSSPSRPAAGAPSSASESRSQVADTSGGSQPSLDEAEQAAARKIIRNADLTLEAETPADVGRRVTSITEGSGGFVVDSNEQNTDAANSTVKSTVTMTIRVPAANFDKALTEVRAASSRVVTERITGQDVTDKFIDLEARVRTKKALEAQFIEIMKTARSVDDALNVQSQLATVRGEIESLEGQLKYLQNQTSFSTIKLTVRPPTIFASGSSGFFGQLLEAFSDGIDAASFVVFALIRIVLALLPLIILFGVPLWLLIRYFSRRAKRRRLAEELAQEPIK